MLKDHQLLRHLLLLNIHVSNNVEMVTISALSDATMETTLLMMVAMLIAK
jgi:hypothetical protein